MTPVTIITTWVKEGCVARIKTRAILPATVLTGYLGRFSADSVQTGDQDDTSESSAPQLPHITRLSPPQRRL
jgi:hypothetical protein